MSNPVGQYDLRFPAIPPHSTNQDSSWFVLRRGGEERQVRFHDYATLYSLPGLYEQLFYDRLKCDSPRYIANLLGQAVQSAGDRPTELRCLDLGAGNGIMAQELRNLGVARVVGVDILPEAMAAAERDRPGVYDGYHAADLSCADDLLLGELQAWRVNCLVSVAALGFGDIPPSTFRRAFDLVEEGGWVAFNLKETFLRASDTSGFARLVWDLILGQEMEVHRIERYAHRLSMDGRPLYYDAVVARKSSGPPTSPGPADLLQSLWEAGHALQAMSRRMERTLGISGPQRLVLREVNRRPGIVPGSLAGLLGIHPSTVTGLVDGLAALSLVERRREGADRRSVHLFPTSAGSALLVREEETIESVVQRSAARLPPEHRAIVESFLHEVSTDLRAAADPDPSA